MPGYLVSLLPPSVPMSPIALSIGLDIHPQCPVYVKELRTLILEDRGQPSGGSNLITQQAPLLTGFFVIKFTKEAMVLFLEMYRMKPESIW